MKTKKFEKVLLWLIFITVFVFCFLLNHLLVAQNEIDVNGVINKSFNTSADTVYSTLVGLLVTFNVVLLLCIGYLMRFIIKFFPQLNLTLQNNTKALEDLDSTIKNIITNEVKTIITQSEQNIIRTIYEVRK